VESVELFVADILTGRWDSVLAQTAHLQLPRDKLIALYEQVVLELIEMRDLELAKEVRVQRTQGKL
jgi:WD40 repeat-containing protein SMU1